MTLFADGKNLGEISDWSITERPAEKRMVLGKEILMPKPKPECSFISPKPVNRRNALYVLDAKKKYVLGDVKIKAGTQVTASIVEEAASK